MPRKATKTEATSAARSSSKRPAPDTPNRQSKRARATARQSYVEANTDTEDPDDAASSNYEDQSENDQSAESEPDASASEDDTNVKQVTSRGRPAKSKTLPVHTKYADEKELWKSGAKLAPGTQIDLAANNDRQWLKLHDPDFRVAFQDFSTFIEKVSDKIIEADETIPELPVKDVIFRIYRDVRFSKDPTPYKTHFSAAWSRTGRKGPYAHYYVQIQPDGGSFVGGGHWQPDAVALSKLRRDIDRKPHKLKSVLRNEGIRKAYLRNVQDDDQKAVKAFTSLPGNQSNALKRNPKDYSHDHKDIDLLRLRSFTMGTKLPDHEILGPGGLDRIAELILSVVPFISYLNSVCMPDEDTSGSSEDESASEGNEAQGPAEASD
ncbi:hypothetical protein T440DRAFT_529753 [Plenodomus tracheiphilus IPT5]|uniref:Uncharacterized protein n=1 Tax=Plenodomus tracheiphilus IPT5 TaxID=1408161 RepID=A0A6A7B8A4_9PLEO|nr:hypothetical protein T440DRAFT_529753 [Plenodomus tracheiphilus IPT5]